MIGSSISWCDDTVNPWWGCARVSPACTHCYAEGVDARFRPGGETHWGPGAARRLRVERAIGELERSARRAVKEGRRRRVFIASMADIFEARPDMVEPRRVFLGTLHDIQEQTGQALIPLLLTKRPEVALEYARANPWPLGAWLGVTVEDQQRAGERIPVALEVAALTGCKVFLSCEPLLGPVDLTHIDADAAGSGPYCQVNALTGRHTDMGRPCRDVPAVSWVIVGGESGTNARPMHPEWARSLRDQCQRAGVPFHFKQWGEFGPAFLTNLETGEETREFRQFHSYQNWISKASTWLDKTDACMDAAGRQCLMGRDFMRARDENAFPVTILKKLGKKAAGRLLDGRTHDDVPR